MSEQLHVGAKDTAIEAGNNFTLRAQHAQANLPAGINSSGYGAAHYHDLTKNQPGEIAHDEDAEPTSCAGITIAGTGNTIAIDPSKSLLENLESHNIPIRSQCRSGICGSCRLKILSGRYERETDFCLSEDDTASGYALACCTYPTTSRLTISLDATS